MATHNKQRIRIQNAKGGKFKVTLPATNGRVLNATETFTQKPAAWKNVKAVAVFFAGKGSKHPFLLQDDSLKEPVVYQWKNGKFVKTDIPPIAEFSPTYNYR